MAAGICNFLKAFSSKISLLKCTTGPSLLSLARMSSKITCGTKEDEVQHTHKPTSCFTQFTPLNVTRFKPVSHVIFDLDGVMLDTLPYFTEAHIKYLRKFNKQYTIEAKMRTLGLSDMDAARYLIKEFQLPITPEVYVHGIWQYLRDDFKKSKLLGGAKNLICHLSEHGVPLCLISSGNTKSFNLKIKDHTKLLNNFCHIVLGDDPNIKNGKPATDLYEVAVHRFHKKPKEPTSVVVFDNSVWGAKGAKNSGLQTVVVANRTIPKEMYKDGADLVVDDLGKIDLADFALPTIPPGKFY